MPDSPPAPLWEGKVEWAGEQAKLHVRNAAGHEQTEEVKGADRAAATRRLLEALTSSSAGILEDKSEIAAVGHRIVNGGATYAAPVRIDAAVKSAIEKMAVFAPLHNRVELEGIRLIEEAFRDVPQVAVFDTGFHRGMPDEAAIYPGPYEWVERGIRRYGFHGINHQYCAERAAQLVGMKLRDLRLVSCHLGNGCSLAAIGDGRSVDTTMGFTPLEGLMMGTRSGSVDQGILTFLMREMRLSGEQLDDLLNKKSGLLGVSGLTNDMRELQAAANNGNRRAQLAIEIFCYRARKYVGAYLAAMGSAGGIVFTGGIGENSPQVRAKICAGMEWAGIEIDENRNRVTIGKEGLISRDSSKVAVYGIPTDEELLIARDTVRCVLGQAHPS